MTRTVHVSTYCGCASPGITSALAQEVFEKAAAGQLAKGRRKPAITRVSRYVSNKSPRLARKLKKALATAKKRISAIVIKAYAETLAKDDTTQAARIQAIIDALNAGTISEDLVDVLTPEMMDAFNSASSIGLTQVSIEQTPAMTDQMDEAARAYAEKRGGELITDLADTTDDDMRALLARAVEDGMSVDQLSDEIDSMGTFGEARATLIARTELAFAHVEGNVEGWRQSDEVTGKRAILGDLHDIADVCDECADVGEVGLDDDFVDGFDFPPFHPACVCDVLPVLKQSDDSEET